MAAGSTLASEATVRCGKAQEYPGPGPEGAAPLAALETERPDMFSVPHAR